jgi:hypothetical protein
MEKARKMILLYPFEIRTRHACQVLPDFLITNGVAWAGNDIRELDRRMMAQLMEKDQFKEWVKPLARVLVEKWSQRHLRGNPQGLAVVLMRMAMTMAVMAEAIEYVNRADSHSNKQVPQQSDVPSTGGVRQSQPAGTADVPGQRSPAVAGLA